MKAGDVIIYYSPRQSMNGDILRAFSAVGQVLDDEPYQVEQALNFRPFRRKTRYFKSKHAPIEPLLKTLEFTRESNNWGFAFRRGMFPISKEDFIVIAEAMQIKTLSGACGGGTAQNGRFPKGDSKLLRLEKPACAEISVMDSPV